MVIDPYGVLRGACFAVGAAIGRPRNDPSNTTRRCKFVKPNRVRICIGVLLSLAPAADEQCSPLHTHLPVVAHDSQGTSCASHMRQHVDVACYGRFATGRCGQRPLRGATGCVFRRRGEHRSSAERSPKYGTRRCKFAKPNRVRICIGVVLSIASAADERCSPLHTHPPVVAHDSQGTSCASHMRQHVCACDTRAHFRQPAKPLTYPKTGNAHNGASRRVDVVILRDSSSSTPTGCYGVRSSL